MLDVKRLRILREVAAHGSFSAAAEALYLSQSAVSQQIATLEREVGMKLLERTREPAHDGCFRLRRAAPEGAPERHRGRAGGVDATAARRGRRSRAHLRL